MIEEKKQKTKQIKRETQFKKNFFLTYLSGSYYNIFRNHQKGIPLTGEKIIKIHKTNYKKQDDKINKFQKKEKIRELQQYKATRAWKYFIKNKFYNILN